MNPSAEHTIPATATIHDALYLLNRLSGGSMTLFVLESDGHVIGTVTDGDIRRALIAGAALTDAVTSAARSDFRALRPGDVDPVETLRTLRLADVRLVPVLDAEGRLAEIIDLSITTNRLPLSALLMAGGRGERLRPLTLTRPKPLLEIEGKAIIDYNIEALAAVGITDITVATGYLAEQLDTHFAEPVAGVQVKTVRETSPLGTIGAVSLIKHPTSGATVIMNSDLITDISFEEMYLRHRDTGADITIAVTPYQVAVPFAILQFDGDHVSGLEEKPSYSYYANAGIYIINNELLQQVAPGKRTDAPDLIQRAIDRGARVVHYPIQGLWIDVGSHTDFNHAAELLHHHNTLKHGRL